ncbi:MAG: ferritin-like domain-containing protein [Polyangiaceae bacterium]
MANAVRLPQISQPEVEGKVSAQSSYASAAARAAVPAKEGPSGTETIGVNHPLQYAWTYASEREDLRVLYEKSKDLMWNARTYLPWDTKVEPEAENIPDYLNPLFSTPLWQKLDPKKDIPNLRRHMASYLISNFLHGEQGALLATAQIVESAPTMDAKFYGAAQVYDEARHVEAYDRYLREKFELIYPVSPHLKKLLDIILTESRWDFKFLGMQIMVEGLALGSFGVIHQTASEPLIKEITHMIMQDEARHVAFGVLSLKDTYKSMNPAELKDREDFVVDSSRMLRDRFLAQEVWERLGLPQKECEKAVDESPFMQLFRKLLFSKIVPNVKRLGLLTPRVRRGFEELGILEFENLDPSA